MIMGGNVFFGWLSSKNWHGDKATMFVGNLAVYEKEYVLPAVLPCPVILAFFRY